VDFRDVLARRRMVRHYADEPVDRATLERIVGSVRRAPSGGHSQGQRLVVVTEPATKDAVAALLGEHEWTAEGLEPWITSAAALVVVCTREQDYHERYQREDKLEHGREIEWPAPFWFVDAGAAMMLLLLAAIDEGLAGGVFGVPVGAMPGFKELLGIPDDVAVVTVVTVGRAAADPQWSERTSRRTVPRRPLDEVVRWERW
jgi:nitroreductase